MSPPRLRAWWWPVANPDPAPRCPFCWRTLVPSTFQFPSPSPLTPSVRLVGTPGTSLTCTPLCSDSKSASPVGCENVLIFLVHSYGLCRPELMCRNILETQMATWKIHWSSNPHGFEFWFNLERLIKELSFVENRSQVLHSSGELKSGGPLANCVHSSFKLNCSPECNIACFVCKNTSSAKAKHNYI